MSEAIIFESMPYNLFLKQRLEFVVICQDHLAASIMRVFEAEMIRLKEAWQTRVEKALEEKKTPPKEPKAYWVRLSLSQIIARLYMYDSGKLKKPESEDMDSPEWAEYHRKKALSISKGTLRKAIEHLISLGFLLERSKPGDEFGAPIWTLHKENVQEALKTLPANPFAIFHALGGGSKFEYGGEVQNLNVPPTNFESGDMQNLNVPGSKNESGEVQNFEVDIDKEIDSPEDSEIDNEIESDSAHESHPSDSGSSEPTRTLSSSQDTLSHGEKGHTHDTSHSGQLPSGRARRDQPDDHRVEVAADERPVGPVAQGTSPQAELSTNTASFTQDGAKTAAPSQDKPPVVPTMPAENAPWKTTTCLQLFNYWRGKPLLGTYKNSQASTCAKGLAANYTREQVVNVRTYMVEDDPYWSQRPERVDVCQVAEHIHEKLAEIARGKRPAAKKRVPTRQEDPYSIAALLEEHNPGYHARKEEMENAWKS